MWKILLVSDVRGHSDEVADILTQIDPRVYVRSVANITEALGAIESFPLMLAVVAHPENPRQIIEYISALRGRLAKVPILVEAPSEYPLVALQALKAGADDYVKTPVAPWEWNRRARCLINAQRQQNALTAAMRRGAKYLLNRKLEAFTPQIMRILGRADIYHDSITGHHELKTARLARLIAEGLSLPLTRCRLIQSGACLHDIGKLAIPDKVLKKPGHYTREDWDVMRDHARLGYEILADGDTAVLRMGAKIALAHHERMDGSGYPYGLKGEDIPLPARITAVADVFESITGRRVYRKSLSAADGLAYLERQAGKLDRDCIAVLRARQDQVTKLVARMNAWPAE